MTDRQRFIQKLFEKLDEELDPEIKKRVAGQVLTDILKVAGDLYEKERQGMAIDVMRNLGRPKPTHLTIEELEAKENFQGELEKL